MRDLYAKIRLVGHFTVNASVPFSHMPFRMMRPIGTKSTWYPESEWYGGNQPIAAKSPIQKNRTNNRDESEQYTAIYVQYNSSGHPQLCCLKRFSMTSALRVYPFAAKSRDCMNGVVS
jgi:hypothetical protein